MTELKNILNRIETEIENSILKFNKENGIPNILGIYCCPWAGWITTNFNLTKEVTNCPDFEFVEFDFIELPELELEYQNELPKFKIDDEIISLDLEYLGDEAINEIIFINLKPLALKIKATKKIEVVLQMLDSKFGEKI